MKSFFQVLFPILIFFLSLERAAYPENALRVEYLPPIVRQGDVCLIRASGAVLVKSIHGEFQGERFPLAFAAHNRTYEGLIGIDMSIRPGAHKVKVVAMDGGKRFYSSPLWLTVDRADFKKQTLSLPSPMVDLDLKTLERVNKEAARLKELFRGFREEKLWSGPFLLPLQGELTGAFGLRRFLNGQPRSSHSGVDLRAEEGTPVVACNNGIAVLADQLFFSGKSVILDHGWGLYSMYFHLSEAGVREGDRVSKGALLGRVGSTGRSTGPHLHWGIRIKGAGVDPLSFLRLTQYLRE